MKKIKNNYLKKQKNASRKPSKVINSFKKPVIVAGVGASAGGLECFEQLFRHLSPDSGLAFVLISHLEPSHSSMLTEILQRVTKMPVVEARENMPVEPNHVYVIPPNKDISLFHNTLRLSAPLEEKGHRMPIDHFFRSLADDKGNNAIGVILSGTGSDGTLGLQAILDSGGVSFVQDPSTAKFEGMPNSAIRNGRATHILPVEKISEQLSAYIKGDFKKMSKSPFSPPAGSSFVNKIMMLIRAKTGHDFSLYKKNTIHRRIEKRMDANNIKNKDAYLSYLKDNTLEIKLLFKELLINVTSFFRDPKAFEVLKDEILRELFSKKPEDYTFRVWVPGCSTGEEVYSIAIIFREYMDSIKQDFRVQIYGTDISESVIAFARAGFYTKNITADVSPERLRCYFSKKDNGYIIKKDIREMAIFAVQNVAKDPPFTKLDLLSCRNLLIYMEIELQNRLIQIFKYALNSGGMLFLSSSETLGRFSDFFIPVNRKWKIFKSKAGNNLLPERLAQKPFIMAEQVSYAPDQPEKVEKKTNFTQIIRNELLRSFVPPCVVSDEKGTIIFVHGNIGKYLQPVQGLASLNVIEMAHRDIQLDIKIALQKAAAKKRSVVSRNIQVKTYSGVCGLDILVKPISDVEMPGNMFVISFQDTQDVAANTQSKFAKTKRDPLYEKSKRVEDMEKELQFTKNLIRSNVAEQQAFNEELKSTNEELQSTNEELQSTNEELETSKEELQSGNEELLSVNAELQSKIEQLSLMQNDWKNLLDSVNMGIIFLDTNLNIKRFTREAAKLFRLVSSDIGRPLRDIKSDIEAEGLLVDSQIVLDSLMPQEKEMRSFEGVYYSARIVPYRTLENVIEGVVITFTDITERKKIEEAVAQARDYAENIVNTVREPLIVLDGELKVISASKAFYETYKVLHSETLGRYVYELGNRAWDVPKLRELLDAVLTRKMDFEDVEIEHDFPVIGRKKMLLNARRIIGGIDKPHLILLAMKDITGRP